MMDKAQLRKLDRLLDEAAWILVHDTQKKNDPCVDCKLIDKCKIVRFMNHEHATSNSFFTLRQCKTLIKRNMKSAVLKRKESE